MPHLKCTKHKRRSIVLKLDDSTKKVVHRGDDDPCDSQWMTWGHLSFVSMHVRSTEESLAKPTEGWVYNERCHCGPCGVERYELSESTH